MPNSQIVKHDSNTKALKMCSPYGTTTVHIGSIGGMTDHLFMQYNCSLFAVFSCINPDLVKPYLCVPACW